MHLSPYHFLFTVTDKKSSLPQKKEAESIYHLIKNIN